MREMHGVPRPEYPRPSFRRPEWFNLNGEWEFGSGDSRTFDGRIVVPFCPQSELSGVGLQVPGDVVWYRHRFDAPDSARLMLHFGAVDYRATVWVNGEEVANHEGGHTPFSADISRFAGRVDNEVVVRAEDPLADLTIPRGKQYWKPTPEGIFYTPTTGIWQTVWLEPLPARYIRSIGIRPNLDERAIEVDVVADSEVEVVASFDGAAVGRWRGAGKGRIALDRVMPWSPEAPHLYRLDASLHDGTDHVASYFGLRKVEARGGLFYLNGEPYVQRLVLDQGYFPGGLLTAGSDAELRRDIELAKAMGFNGARKHQKVEDPRWLYWADTLGFLVWEEMANFHEHSPEAERRLIAEWREAVVRDRDHPSIVAWVPMNESFGLGSDPPPAFLNALHAQTHELDGTRPVMSNDGWEHTTSDLCTLHDYRSAEQLRRQYRSLDMALAPDARPHPPYLPGYAYRGEPLVVSEFGGMALTGSGGFGWSEASGGESLLNTYEEMVKALMGLGPVEGFCYTQLTDIEQERNGLLTFKRMPKVDPRRLRPITQMPKKR
jgi:beta-galactosidase/beta-glucuronidase